MAINIEFPQEGEKTSDFIHTLIEKDSTGSDIRIDPRADDNNPTGVLSDPYHVDITNFDDLLNPLKGLFNKLLKAIQESGIRGASPFDFLDGFDIDKGKGKTKGRVSKSGKGGFLKRTASKAGGFLKSGAKVAANGAKIAAEYSWLLAPALAAYDGISGYNDEKLHQRMFDLKPGEKASDEQKIRASRANIGTGLTMGLVDQKDADKVFQKYDELIGNDEDRSDFDDMSIPDGVELIDISKKKEEPEKSINQELSKSKTIMPSTPITKTIQPVDRNVSNNQVATQINNNNVNKRPVAVPLDGSSVSVIPTVSSNETMVERERLEKSANQELEKSQRKDTSIIDELRMQTDILNETQDYTEDTRNALFMILKMKGIDMQSVRNSMGMEGNGSGAQSDFANSTNGGSSGNGPGNYTTPSGNSTGSFQVSNPNELGSLSERFESGGKGTATIGYDGKGGTSYGRYQLASNAHSLDGWLKMIEQDGPEGAAIAQQMRAAGPLNTGSRSGAAVDVYKRLAAEHGDYIDKTQKEYIKRENFDPMMRSLEKANPQLAQMVKQDSGLQQVAWSTAVQHGPTYGASVFKNAWKNSASGGSNPDRNAFIDAVYADRSGRFGSSSADIRASVQNRFRTEATIAKNLPIQSNAPGAVAENQAQNMVAGAMPGAPQINPVSTSGESQISVSANNLNPPIGPNTNQGTLHGDASAFSQLIAAQTNAKEGRVSYQMGGKNSARGAIDCSGWVSESGKNMMRQVNAAAGKEVYSKKAMSLLNDSAAGIIKNVQGATGVAYGNQDLTPDKVKEGTIIGIGAKDEKSHGAGRWNNIGHVVQVYRDPNTGQMMVSESQSGKSKKTGKTGVQSTTYEEWFKRYGNRKLHGTDLTALAGSDGNPKIDPNQLAQNNVSTEITNAASGMNPFAPMPSLSPTNVPMMANNDSAGNNYNPGVANNASNNMLAANAPTPSGNSSSDSGSMNMPIVNNTTTGGSNTNTTIINNMRFGKSDRNPGLVNPDSMSLFA